MSLPLEQLVDESTILPGSTLAFGLTGQRITGVRVVLEWIVRAWFQPRGANRLAPNSTVDVRELENATLEDRELEGWRVSLIAAAKAAAIGYLAGIDVTVRLIERVTKIRGLAVFFDGSRHELAVTIGAIGTTLKFGGAS